ncbi:hypothetical protein [Paenibacillus sp. LPE1-1-1.1]|uniref:hypothetical protein n=1 Tax=Paenibacillus sp. LPE1-1-1.1 TaxID=3135230 RepID=UPI0034124249
MRLTELASVILRKDIPTFPYNPDHLEKREMIFRMTPFTDINQQGGIWYPDVTITESFQEQRNDFRLTEGIKIVEQFLIDKGVAIKLDEKTDAIFTLLHEEGHWDYYVRYYIDLGKSGNAYNDDNAKISDEMGITSLKKQVQANNELYGELQRVYREHPFEKYADEYAVKKMKEINN